MEGLESSLRSSSLVGETVEATVDQSVQGTARKRIRNSYDLLPKESGNDPSIDARWWSTGKEEVGRLLVY